jgi:hypothetical protein
MGRFGGRSVGRYVCLATRAGYNDISKYIWLLTWTGVNKLARPLTSKHKS